jgi:hypothetical protein
MYNRDLSLHFTPVLPEYRYVLLNAAYMMENKPVSKLCFYSKCTVDIVFALCNVVSSSK